MRSLSPLSVVAVVALFLLGAATAAAFAQPSAGDWSGYLALEGRTFEASPSFALQQEGDDVAFVFEPEYYREIGDGDSSLSFKGFLRLDSLDSERSHLDVRELYWRKASGRWELLAGIGKVFWGVTESQHLVDVINQTDAVENPDGEDKLGQPMMRLSLIRGWGVVELYLLPGFRERTFPGPEGRLRTPLPVDADRPVYESSAGDEHVDAAVRWSRAVGPFDLGLSHFHGTSREPRFLPAPDRLIPLYEQIDQTGVDAQATLGNWLLKLEGIRRSGQGDTFAAATTGFEYSFWSIFSTNIDLGAVVEYLWDERGDGASTPFQDDTFVGARFAFNDVQSSEILAGAIIDAMSDATFYLVEASRRFGSNWVLEAELRVFSGLDPADPFAALSGDDYFQLSVQRHF